MKILDSLKKVEEEPVVKGPVSEQSIKDLINLINVANDVNCSFDVTFTLKDGDFVFDSSTFNSIEFFKKTKNEDANILITYSDALLKYNVTIRLDDVIGATFVLTFCAEGDDEDV